MSEFDDLNQPDTPSSPNAKLDKAIDKLIVKIDDKKEPIPPDIAVKILTLAVNWEKVKHGIRAKNDTFDPDEL